MKKMNYYLKETLDYLFPQFNPEQTIYTVVPWSKVQDWLKVSFEKFATIFEDHVGKKNSGFILEKHIMPSGSYPPINYSFWFYAGHYEGGSDLSLMACQYLLHEFEQVKNAECQVELLDCAAEKLLIQCYLHDYKHIWDFFEKFKLKEKNIYIKTIGEKRDELYQSQFEHEVFMRLKKSPEQTNEIIQKAKDHIEWLKKSELENRENND
jgi:hypothetical protein